MNWFEESPESEIAVSLADPNVMLMELDVPDAVRLPVELGGEVVGVSHQIAAECPCDCGIGLHKTLILVNGIRVAKCPVYGYQWYVESAVN